MADTAGDGTLGTARWDLLFLVIAAVASLISLQSSNQYAFESKFYHPIDTTTAYSNVHTPMPYEKMCVSYHSLPILTRISRPLPLITDVDGDGNNGQHPFDHANIISIHMNPYLFIVQIWTSLLR